MHGTYWIFTGISFLILLSSLIFNACGIVLLKLLRGNALAQTVIIINLSISEIFIAIGWLAELVATSISFTFNDRVLLVIWAIRAGFYCFWFVDMYILSLDRFMGCIIPLRHRVIMNKSNVRRLIICLWFACISNSLLLLILDTKVYFRIYNKYVWISLDCIAVIIYALTYISIYCNTSNSARLKSRLKASSEYQEDSNKANMHFFKVVGLIILSFVIFEFCPSVTEMSFYFTDTDVPEVLDRSIRVFYQLNLLLDPLIYIFLPVRVRSLLFNKLRQSWNEIRRKFRKPAVIRGNELGV